MLNALLPHVVALRERWPRLYAWLVSVGRRHLRGTLGIYPRPLANELGAVADVLRGSQWNMAYGKGLVHERLEHAFADYVGAGHAIAVNTGGMALQMSIRALGLKPGDEIIHQVDTCAASALAVVNAGCTPFFADISADTFMLSMPDARAAIGSATKAIIATHMWGSVEDLDAIADLQRQYGLRVIEDACLALGATHRGRRVGAFGDVGVFSFGCLKPIQTGEGGMIVTDDEALARRARHLSTQAKTS
ncbi:MAG: DegT/DnrJ/EryC1/StrS family aminotransferase, partial [Steroidobacteraceae bacterium]